MNLTIKFISNVHRMGSSESMSNRISGMSKAAGKFNFTIGTSIKRRNNNNKQDQNGDLNNSRSFTIEVPDCSKEEAAVIGTYIFNYLDREENSQKYTSAKSEFDTAKRKILNDFAVSDYDELTKEQRIMYAKKMVELRAPFNYTERCVHIKYGDYMSVFSKTHRCYGVRHWNRDNAEAFVRDTRTLMDHYDVSVQKTDESDSVNPESTRIFSNN